jgi:hypothetical protein
LGRSNISCLKDILSKKSLIFIIHFNKKKKHKYQEEEEQVDKHCMNVVFELAMVLI